MWQLEHLKLHVRLVLVAHGLFLLHGAVLSLSVEGGQQKLLPVSRF